MRKLFYFLIFFSSYWICSVSVVNAQGVSVNVSGSVPDSSAMIDVSSLNKGALIPRMSTSQRNAISGPALGLIIFNTDCHTFDFNAGTPSAPNWATLNSSNVLVAGATIAANPAGAICAGNRVTFTATAANGGLSPTYQWLVNGNNIAGAVNSTFSDSTLNNGDAVTCIVTSNASCVTGSPATSNTIIVTINASPDITGTTPGSNCGAGAVELGATASSGIINWYADSTGGSSLGAGTSFTTPAISSTTAYYTDATLNGCTTSSRTAVTASIFSGSPAQPGNISGPVSNLGGQTGIVYSVDTVSNATSYNWSVPSGVSIVGGGGTSVNVNFTCSNNTGNITVTASNICGTSSQQTITVSTVPQQPGSITGPTAVCQNTDGNVYSISSVPYAASYTWSVPSDATIAEGQGTTSITVTFGVNSGNISVTETTNSCGTSDASAVGINNNSVSTFTFSPSPTETTQNTTFNPTNTSGATYSWTFSGGSPAASNDVNPVVVWSAKGTYSATLTVNGCSATSTTNSVNVLGYADFSYTGSMQSFTVPGGITSITIQANGAAGGGSGGLGASMQGTFSVTAGHVLNVLTGGQGGSGSLSGGGGGSFVVDNHTNTLLIAAGGGGGGGCCSAGGPSSVSNGTTSQSGITGWYGGCLDDCGGYYNVPDDAAGGTGGDGGGTETLNPSGGGGGGYYTNGASGDGGGGKSYTNGGAGGAGYEGGGSGGYGGGGGGENDWDGGGGGGGYSGGGGGYYYGEGGGGGSYNAGGSQTNVSGAQSGNGDVIITY